MADQEPRTLSLTPDQAAFLSSCVESGRYQSASDAVRAALRLLEDVEARRNVKLARVRAMIAEGVAELDRGEVVDAEEFFAGWDERLRARADTGPAKAQ